MKYNYSIYEDNAGRLHLAVMDENGSFIYYLCDADRALVVGTLDALKAGGDPIADGWEGGEPDPTACYEEITNIVDARNGGASMLNL
jgi:hypothetical protein|nr:MAG TPA: hypothetical protein [Caudoviricetes sp.]